MKYLDEYRDPELAQRLFAEIRRITTRPWAIMEVCGGQTHSIIRNGIDQLLPEEIELIHGPGCPVCVTPLETIDKALAIASRPNVIFCSFGDMLRVPGSAKDLFRVKSEGGDVRIVYSPLDAVRLAQQHPRPRGCLLWHRVRDDRACQCDGSVAGAPSGTAQLFDAGIPRPGAASDFSHHGVADKPGTGVSGCRARVQRHGHLAVPAAR
jgi:hypothetical protein